MVCEAGCNTWWMIHILWNRLERDVSQIDVAYPFLMNHYSYIFSVCSVGGILLKYMIQFINIYWYKEIECWENV